MLPADAGAAGPGARKFGLDDAGSDRPSGMLICGTTGPSGRDSSGAVALLRFSAGVSARGPGFAAGAEASG